MPKFQQFRDQLLALRDQLRNDSDQLANEFPEHVNQPGELSTVDQHNADHDSEGLDREIDLLSIERQLLDQVNDALGRLAQGTYGICQSCGKKISSERLSAIPYTPYCVACAQQQEQMGPSR